ncbi:MAG: hypothetical protein LBB72_09360 [Spirochaetaceae bacterium]|jgi:hypothetical protein|nr:hypothetical protein [Spirochaetaceae bacterium]
MNKPVFFCLAGLLLWNSGLFAQELLLEELPALKDKAIVLKIDTKVEENSKAVMNTSSSKITIPGRAVSIKLVGENLIIEIQFTPYLRSGKYTLVAQSQIWIKISEKEVSYKTTNHSMSMDLGEQILYLPLGTASDSNTSRIELLLTLYRYGEGPPAEEAENQ